MLVYVSQLLHDFSLTYIFYIELKILTQPNKAELQKYFSLYFYSHK